MTTVDVNASVKYKVVIGEELLCDCGNITAQAISPCKAAVISDSNVFPLYGEKVKTSLENAGFSTVQYVFPAGEKSKNLNTYSDIIEFLARQKLSRTDIIIALGGGVVGDMAGFCAATYLRGIRFVQIPTTILSACDSSVGGKTAVDISTGKNLVGAFHQPSLVICDTDTFETLPSREVSCGLSEIIKYGVICDKELFEELASGDYDIQSIITRCVEIKRDIVEKDEKETGERKLLNLGHTLGHAVEKHSGFALSHGEAVAVGMMMISEISEKLGYGEKITERLKTVLEKYSLPCAYDITKKEMFDISCGDKKVDGKDITLVIPCEIGKCILEKVTLEKFSDMLSMILE